MANLIIYRLIPARKSVLIIVFSKPDPERKSQSVNDLMLIFSSQRNYNLSSGFSVERLRQVLLYLVLQGLKKGNNSHCMHVNASWPLLIFFTMPFAHDI